MPAQQSLYRSWVRPGQSGGRGRALACTGPVCAVVASRRCPFPPISLPRCSSSAARWTRPPRIRMRGMAGPADGFAAVARAAASSRPRTGRPRVAALSVLPSACGSFSRRQRAIVCGKAGRACSLVIVSENDFALNCCRSVVAFLRTCTQRAASTAYAPLK